MSGVAFAQTAAPKAEKPKKMDCKAKFEAMDANKDGKVAADEWAAAMKGKKNAEKAFKAKDKNKDGSITMDEACPAPKAKKAK